MVKDVKGIVGLSGKSNTWIDSGKKILGCFIDR